MLIGAHSRVYFSSCRNSLAKTCGHVDKLVAQRRSRARYRLCNPGETCHYSGFGRHPWETPRLSCTFSVHLFKIFVCFWMHCDVKEKTLRRKRLGLGVGAFFSFSVGLVISTLNTHTHTQTHLQNNRQQVEWDTCG